MLESCSNVWDPLVIPDSLVAVDKSDKDVGEQASDIESDEAQDEVVLLLGDKQCLTPLPTSAVSAGFSRVICLGRTVVVR